MVLEIILASIVQKASILTLAARLLNLEFLKPF